MEPIIIFSAFLLFVSVAWFIRTYNRFIKYKNSVEESWSAIDVALKRRFNLIPNLIQTIKGYSEHETKLIQTKKEYLTSSKGISNRAQEESQISNSLHGLLALAEDYPDLKASANFVDLQNNLDEIEEDIQNARNRYNNYIRRFNTLVESFPAIYIARKFGFHKKAYFLLDLATQRELPAVQFSDSRDSKRKN